MGPKKIAAGRTEPGDTNWQAFSSNSLFVDVDTSAAGFSECPIYVTSLAGNATLVHMEGMTSLYPPGAPVGSPGGPPPPGATGPTAKSFRVYINFMLKDEYTRFFDVSRQNVALLFLVLGWLLTSAEARAFLARYAWIRWSSMALATAWFILNAIKEIHRVGSSSRFYAALLDVDWNIATRYCRRFLVDYGAVLPVLLLELALIVLILVLVWCCASRPVAPTAVKE